MTRTVRRPAAPDSAHGSERDPAPVRILLAFAAIYLVWGSTYLAIRWAIETMPPLLMGGARFIVAGSLLFAWARSRGAPAPTRVQWRASAIAGGLMLAGGTGAVMFAQQWVPSGLAALLIASMPLWLVLLDWAGGGRVRPTVRTLVGLGLGIGGVVLLLGAPGVGGGGPMELFGALLILGGSVSWACGSLYSRYAPTPPRPRLWVAMQMLAGGAILTVAALLHGDLATVDVGAISVRSWLALAYLVVFGALVAYSAYVWLISVVPPARAGTYAFVNPVVALVLGAVLANEPITPRAIVAAGVILGGVVIITLERGRPVPAVPAPVVAAGPKDIPRELPGRS
jgi:drug/metabolite transporter (DMT)-like permease